MTKAQSVKRGIHSLALLSALVLAGCSSTDPNMNLPAAVKTAGSADQITKSAHKANAQTGPEVLMSAGQNNGSYNNMRRALVRSELPAKNGIQLAEWVNFFPYDYPQTQGRIPFSAVSEMANTPWNPNTRLLRVAIKADDAQTSERRAANLVVFVGADGSDLSLIKLSLTRLVNQLTAQDSLAIITTAGDNGVLLAPTYGSSKDKMLSAIDNLKSGKANKDTDRLSQAYSLAKEHYLTDGINRVIMAGNSNFSAGFKDIAEAQNFFANQQNSGVSLTALGFTATQFTPSSLAEIADEGNGVYSYIDNQRDADKIWSEQLRSTQTPVAKDFSMKVEFNPSYVKAYRLLGYQAPATDNESANKGIVVTGQTLTALYEVIPAGDAGNWAGQEFGPIYTPSNSSYLSKTKEMAMVHLRYHKPTAQGDSQRIELPVPASRMNTPLKDSSQDFRFAAAVAAFAQQLKDGGVTTGNFTLNDTLKLANEGQGSDKFELRGEFIQLVKNAQEALPKASPVKGKEDK
ncbi:vWA domain-containing protein [Pragia fontium]|uniref:vWA domain-containing protein n=1 Tax=Pragia fontium TaxID=82985 RepID=UPI00069C0350|nr:von Willebrand factor type A domain-containing protein [Pragia fontium]